MEKRGCRGGTAVWKLTALSLGLAAAVSASGCSGGRDVGYRKLVDDFAAVTLAQDQDSAAYDQALAAVGAYLEDSGEETLSAARRAVTETRIQMEEDGAALTPYELDEDLAAVLEDYGLDPEEYVINADMRAGYLSGYAESLKNLEFYLEHESADQESVTRPALEFLYDFRRDYQECTRGFCFYGINYWFAGWEGEALDYVRSQVTDRLRSFVTEESVWEDSREGVERKLDLYLRRMEECQQEFQEYLGEAQEDLYRLEQE
ncbi:MAG TPA: hypothetical protein IAA17_10420 [Candidatus Lachnoclostridium stercorigallinarum]|uniref:Lipoprotein n=1 Tax=Candidatus Lachnoclostridium stercorigallinarum TaxID=2838634 RepID=A0A9D2GI47_9FIRM|nr:hypothetical protein [Candidatus Lachnoclostridium stercorigallinarum]